MREYSRVNYGETENNRNIPHQCHINVVYVYNIFHSFLLYVFKINIPNKQKSRKRDIETHTKVQRDRHTNVDKDTKRETERTEAEGE